MKRGDTRFLTTVAVLTAMEIVLSRFCSISAWNVKIGFSFLPVAAAAVLLGPLAAGAVAALGDLVGAVLFPIGAYFPGFTLSAAIMGALFGLLMHRRQTRGRVLAAVGASQLVCTLLLNTLWISALYGAPLLPLLLTRSVQCVVLAPVQCVTILAMLPLLGHCGRGLQAWR